MAPLSPFLRQHWKFVAAAAVLVFAALVALSATGPRGVAAPDYGEGFAGGAVARGVPAPALAARFAGGPVSSGSEAPITTGERKVITSGNLRVEVVNVSTAVDALTSMATRYGGFVASSSRSLSSSGIPSGSVTLRIPNASFPAVLVEARRLGKVLRENVQGEDITEQFVDLQARLGNAKAQEKRFLVLLDRAQNVSEVLLVERELGRIRGEVESMQGQLNFLANRAEMATLTVEVTEPVPLGPPAPFKSAWDTLQAAIEGFLGMIGALVVVAATLLPLGVVVWAGWKIYKKRWGPPGTAK